MNPTRYQAGRPVYVIRDPDRPRQKITITIEGAPDGEGALVQWGLPPNSLDHEYVSDTLARVILEFADSQGLIFPPENMSA